MRERDRGLFTKRKSGSSALSVKANLAGTKVGMGSMAHTLLPDPRALCLDHIAVEGGGIVFHGATTARTAARPVCGSPSARIHSPYRRTLQNLP